MRKLYFILFLVLLLISCRSYSYAQLTTASAQVKDPAGTLYVNCSYTVSFFPNPHQTIPYTYGGSQSFTKLYPTQKCDGSANFQIQLPDNVNAIVPNDSQWHFDVCSATGYSPGNQFCFSANITITGATQTITSQLQAAAPILPLGYPFPLTTKGDLFGFNGTGPARIPVGPAGDCLVSDPLSAVGVSWVAGCGGGGGGGGGSVTSVNGTTGQVNVSNPTTTPVVSLVNPIVGAQANDTQVVGNGSNFVPQTKPKYDVRDYGAILDGTTDNSVAYSSLLGIIGSAKATVTVSGPMAMQAIATPSNVTLEFVQSGAFVLIANTTPVGGGSLVQVSTPTTNGNPYTGSCSTTFSTPVTAGNTVVMFTEHFFTGSDDIPPTDNQNDFYRIGTKQSFNYPSLLSNWYSSNVHGGSTTVTLALAGTVENQCVAIEIAGLGASVNVTSGQVGTEFLGHPSTTMSTGGSAGSQPQITFPNGTFIVANGGQSFIDSRPCTAQAGFTIVATTGGASNANPSLGGNGDSMCVEYQAASGAVTEHVTTTITTDPLVTTTPIRGWFMTGTGLIAGPATVAIAGPIIAPQRQIFFNATGTLGAIDLTGNQSITTVYPEWWGACGSCSASVNTPAIQAAINAAYGTARINGSGLNQYDRELHFSALYSINGTLNGNHMNGFNWTCEERLACGLQQVASNTPILQTTCGGTYGAFHKMNWSTNTTQNISSPLVDLNYTCAPSSDLVTQFIDFFENGWGGNNQAAVGTAIARAGGGAQGSNINFYDNNWIGFTEAGVLIGNASGGYTPGNGQGGINCTALATNALAINFYNGDIQSSPTYGIENCGGGFIIVDGMSFENGFGNQIGCDLGLRSGAAGDKFVIRGVRSESICLATGTGDFDISQSATVDQSFFPNPGQTPGGVGGPLTVITPSVANPQNGAYYKFTAVSGPYSGLGNPTTPLTAASGTANTLTDSVGGFAVNAWANWILGIIGGTGKLTYCKIASNTTSTFTCQSSTFLTNYAGVVATTPDATSQYVVEPDYTTMTVNGGVTFGPVTQIPVLGNLTAHNFFIPGLQVNFGPIVHGDIQVTRTDFFPNQLGGAGLLDSTVIRPLDMQIQIPQLSHGGADGASGPPYKVFSWSSQVGPRPSRAFSTTMGTGTIMWGSGTGTGSRVLDAGVEPDPTALAVNSGCMRFYNDSTGVNNLFVWRWCYDGSWWNPGSVLWSTDNTNDMGAAGANRPRTVYAGTSFVAAGKPVPVTVASGTAALNTVSIASATCDTVVTAAATGVVTTDVVEMGFNGDPTAVTGYVPATTGTLFIVAYPTAGNVNFKVCNNTANPITPGAITLNWRVTR